MDLTYTLVRTSSKIKPTCSHFLFQVIGRLSDLCKFPYWKLVKREVWRVAEMSGQRDICQMARVGAHLQRKMANFFLNFFYVSYLLNVTPALSVANNLNGTRTASIFLLENGRRKMSPKLVGVDIFFIDCTVFPWMWTYRW